MSLIPHQSYDGRESDAQTWACTCWCVKHGCL